MTQWPILSTVSSQIQNIYKFKTVDGCYFFAVCDCAVFLVRCTLRFCHVNKPNKHDILAIAAAAASRPLGLQVAPWRDI